jgi:hypothetical protein
LPAPSASLFVELGRELTIGDLRDLLELYRAVA